jgi:hypothetical protein
VKCTHCNVTWSEHGSGSQLCYDTRAHDRIAELAKEVARLTVLLGEVEDTECDYGYSGTDVKRVLKQWRGR